MCLRAAEVAKRQGHEGRRPHRQGRRESWRVLCDVEVRVPHDGYADRIQEVHIKVIHALIDQIERRSLARKPAL